MPTGYNNEHTREEGEMSCPECERSNTEMDQTKLYQKGCKCDEISDVIGLYTIAVI